MTQHDDTAPTFEGTDVSADPSQLQDGDVERRDPPATSDPEQMTDGDSGLGGTAGAGGAG